MNPSRLFIMRPVATTLLMVALLLSGLIAYRQLATSALPDVDYPTIQVFTFYPGGSPDVLASSVTAPLERQLGQIPGLKQMSSTSSGGASVITLQFDLTIPPLNSVVPGVPYHFQLYYRDPMGGGQGFNTTDALTIVFTP